MPVIVTPLRVLKPVVAIIPLFVSPLGLSVGPTITTLLPMSPITFSLLTLDLLILRALMLGPLPFDLLALHLLMLGLLALGALALDPLTLG